MRNVAAVTHNIEGIRTTFHFKRQHYESFAQHLQKEALSSSSHSK